MAAKGKKWDGPGLRQVAAAGMTMAAAVCLMPALVLGGGPAYSAEPAPQSEAVLPLKQAARTAGTKDRGRAVRLKLKDGTVVQMTAADYLWGVVAAEMPAAFEEEALKAQACAARTYTAVQQQSPKHDDADLCADSTCCQAYRPRNEAEARWGLNAGAYGDKITRAVAATDGLGVVYNGKPIQALFFSSAPGKTADAVEVWGSSVAYLKSVDSPEGEEVPNWRSRVSLAPEEVKAAVLAACPGADLSAAPAGWFGTPERGENGAVTSIPVGGVTLTGGQVRSLFALRSAAFDLTWDGAQFHFDVTGYGHGVGMSQYGANAMAGEGKTFRDILTWYYTGAEVAELW